MGGSKKDLNARGLFLPRVRIMTASIRLTSSARAIGSAIADS